MLSNDESTSAADDQNIAVLKETNNRLKKKIVEMIQAM